MEKFLNSKFMQGLNRFGQKLGANPFMSSLQSAMMQIIGITLVGAIFQIITAVGPLVGLFEQGSNVYNVLHRPYVFTMELLSVWVVLFLSYQYAKALRLSNPLMRSLNSVICFLFVVSSVITNEQGQMGLDKTFLDASGMFVGFIIVFIVIRIEKFCIDKNIGIKISDVVPKFLQDSLSSLVPLFLEIVLFMILNQIILSLTGGVFNIPSGFLALLSAPINLLISTPGMFVLGIFATFMWIFGIHGTLIVMTVVLPIVMQVITENAALVEQGLQPEFHPVFLFSAIAVVGGTGNTLGLVLLGLRSKSEQIRAVSKTAILPGWFNVNEPVTFGMPIMYNPILAIPYILSVPINMLLVLIGYKVGFLTPGWIPVFALLPMGFSSYFSTLSIKNAIFDYLLIIPSLLIYYPFFKVYERQLVKEEKEMANEA